MNYLVHQFFSQVKVIKIGLNYVSIFKVSDLFPVIYL
jgi:hypothetical protein